MAEQEQKKKNKISPNRAKDAIAIFVAVALIAVYIVYECYSAVNVEIRTCTAQTVTVYDTIDAMALVVRDESVIEGSNASVTVPSVDDGEKVKKNGEIATCFSSADEAQRYARRLALERELLRFENLESQSVGTATDVQSINEDILNDLNSYIRSVATGKISNASSAVNNLNDTLIRRQLIIGSDIDFTVVKEALQKEIDAVSGNAKPTGYVNTDMSGIFSSGTDGAEELFGYDTIEDLNVNDLQEYIEQVKDITPQKGNLGKIIKSYAWYLCAVVDTEKLDGMDDGAKVSVAIKDSDRVLKCTIVSGTQATLGQQQTVLVLKCSDMDQEIAAYRLEDIEIRCHSYTGIEVPISAVHEVDGKKGVYVLVSDQVKFRQAEVLYTDKEYMLLSYSPENSDGIRIYDEIITEGKELYHGKVYS